MARTSPIRTAGAIALRVARRDPVASDRHRLLSRGPQTRVQHFPLDIVLDQCKALVEPTLEFVGIPKDDPPLRRGDLMESVVADEFVVEVTGNPRGVAIAPVLSFVGQEVGQVAVDRRTLTLVAPRRTVRNVAQNCGDEPLVVFLPERPQVDLFVG